MMSEAIQLPAVGDLVNYFATRPNLTAVSQMIEGVSGKDLFDAGELGVGALEGIQQSHIEIRNYLKRYDRKGGDYWQDRRGKQELIGESYAKERTAEVNLWTDLMDHMVTIMADYARARSDAEKEAKRKLEQQQRGDDERAKAARLAELNALHDQAERDDDMFLAQDTQLEIESIKSTPIIPPVVTPQQAAAAVGLPAMPKGLVSNKKPIYEHTITDARKLVAWLNANPAYIDRFTIEPKAITLKNTVFPKDSGVETREKRSIQNRGK